MARRRREQITPDLTPLIDVVFLLLIFFLVSSVFKKEELALLLSLPKTEKGASAEQKETKNITIELSKNEIAFNGNKIQVGELESNLKSVKKSSLINLRVDGTVVYKRLVNVLDILQKNKLNNVSLITDKGIK